MRDLSGTEISQLPTEGLTTLKHLTLQNVPNLWVFPSPYSLQELVKARLTYPYHCCVFQFPEVHDPVLYAETEKKLQEQCREHQEQQHRHLLSLDESQDGGTWHNKSFNPVGGWGCENDSRFIPKDVNCEPRPDAFNPCEDILGHPSLRITAWIVIPTALLGNLAVLVVILCNRRNMTVGKFLMCNLACADLGLGLYLLAVAVVDLRTMGFYFNYAIPWQQGLGCEIAGFVTVFSCELSIVTLSVLTGERWYAITHAIRVSKRLRLPAAAKVMAGGWLFAIAVAALPLFGVSDYSKTR
ncbi:unnamed protein product [Darwinula stevensoni]|uniref:G-protein coupled receptors family 1 profile domain-containing protein n=1 Tax=Darwinula stevensoni TaxID=69355 RepID=A0A7R9A4I9_9CRUS|nr:unnamed protein product [Darwinula stevensoni]CAG0890138.1 unnamed protein product [Darwinula stevensoni]